MNDAAPRDEAFEGRALVAAFGDRDAARRAARQLHEEGFHRIWLGVTNPTRDTADAGGTGVAVEPDDDSLGNRIGRFFSGENNARSLHSELLRHGVDQNAAATIERSLTPGSTVLTLDGSNHPELAANIVEQCGGYILSGETFGTSDATEASTDTATGTATARTGEGEGRRGSEILGYRQPERYARGEEIDEEQRLRLRAERLQIAKQREEAGVATVGKDVIEKTNEVDVPVVREELFVERRSIDAAENVDADTTPIEQSDAIRIPLVRERVVVTKRPVVTDEYVVGKRQVTDTQHVSETTREEKLAVDEGATRP